MGTSKSLYGLLQAISDDMIAAEAELTQLDSILGDGDCGQGMKAGFTAVKKGLAGMEDASAQDILKKVAKALISEVGGTSGAIYGTFFMKAAGAVVGCSNGLAGVAEVLEAGLNGAKMRGEDTRVGDKTLIDALEPAVFAFKEKALAGESMYAACNAAYKAAQNGSDSTINLIARKGRASYLGERSRGHRDAGSWGIVVIAKCVAEYMK